MPALRIDVVSIFPEYFQATALSIVGRAIDTGIVDFEAHQLRQWTNDRHKTVDDSPYGGGAGMVMKAEPWGQAIDDLARRHDGTPRLLVMSPSGRPFDQAMAHELALEPWLIMACGRYEGIDTRVMEDAATTMVVEEVSIGDYVLNGGEVAALVLIEAIVRLIPGVLGNPESLAEESHEASHDGLLEYPVYTKPAVWRDREVPAVLRSGDHAAIGAWRRQRALDRTAQRRPDLLTAPTPVVTVATEADVGELFTLHRAVLSPPPVTLDSVTDALATGTVLVARQGQRLIGSIRATSTDGVWHVDRLAVAPDQPREGAGALLVEAIERHRPDEDTVIRVVTPATPEDIFFYRSHRYREVDAETSDLGPVVVMEKHPR